MTELFLLLAQVATSQPRGATPQAPPGLFSSPLMLVGAMVLIFYMFVFRPQGAEKKRREEMLKSIKKNDRVLTSAGIVGVVQMVKDDEVTLKVDESNNTKITFARWSIQRVLSAAPVEGSAAASTPPKK